MPLVDRPRHVIHYEEHGDRQKPPVLLIMGLAVSSRAWDRLPQLLARDFRVLVFDNIGTGKSGKRGYAYSMKELAADAAAVLDFACARSAHVFGVSMGGMIAQELAIRKPERLRSLALGCTFASWRKGVAPSFATKLDLALVNLGFATPERLGRVLVSSDFHSKDPRRIVEWLRDSEQAALRYAAAQVIAIARHHTLDRLHRIRAPTLVITGTADRLVPFANSEVLARNIPDARLHLLHGAGHCFPLEREEETVRVLREHFLANEMRSLKSA